MKAFPFQTTILFSALLGAFTAAQAQTPLETPPMTVTASRTVQLADQALASVTVLTREDLERASSNSLLDVLRLQAGIDMARTGGAGQQTSVFLRGTESNHLLVLIDGVRVAAPSTGGFAWSNLPVSQIERIEIVRGPRASMYGSEAIGGVIQIFTRAQQDVSVKLTGGSFGTRRIGAGAGGAGDGMHWGVHAEYSDIEGFSAQNADGFSFDPDDDGSETVSISAQFGADLSDALSLSASFLHSDTEAEFDQGVSDGRNQSLSLRLDHQASATWHQQVSFGSARDDLATASAFGSEIETRRHQLDWQHDIRLGNNFGLSAGLAYSREEGSNIDSFGATVYDQDTDNRAAFGILRTQAAGHDLELSARLDHHSEFGSHSSGQLAWGHDLSDRVRMHASYGSAYRAPNLNELFHPGFFGFFAGNPNLDPEQSRSAELGLRAKLGTHQTLGLQLWHTEIEDMIAFQGANAQAINIREVEIPGVELSYGLQLERVRLNANATWQQPQDQSDDSLLLRRAERKAALQLGYDLDRGADVGAELSASGPRRDFDALGNIIALPGYAVVNLYGNVPLARGFSLQARIDNLMDREYELVSGFNTSERAFYLSLNYRNAL